MAKRKNSYRQKTFTFGGEKYTSYKKNNSVTVKISRTAKGQQHVAGTLNLSTGEWSIKDYPFPIKVQEMIKNFWEKENNNN